MAATKPADIIELLKKDHREVEALFAEFEKETQAAKQAALASRIGQALTIHAEIEENLFYPVVLELLDDDGADLTCEATVEHGTLRGLIAGMNGKDVSSPMVKAHVIVLKEYVEHHVREEEKELFPRVKKLGLDLDAMGEDMLKLKQQLSEAADGPRKPGPTITVIEVSARDVAVSA
jgi:hemerythrin superfamily protein